VPEGVDPKDRGDHSRGEHGPPMPLIYRKAVKPEDLELLLDQGVMPEG
jgi:hypothetical protein